MTTTRILNGETWLVHSPSLYEHAALPVCVAFDGLNWRVSVEGKYGPRPFATRDDAVLLCARAQEKWTQQDPVRLPEWPPSSFNPLTLSPDDLVG